MPLIQTLIVVGALLMVSPLRSTAAETEKFFRLDDEYPAVKVSFYTHRILKFLESWPPPTLALFENSKPDQRQFFVRGIRTPGQEDTVGFVKHFIVYSPLNKVVEVSERYEDYPKIWKEVVNVNVESRDKNRTVTEWTRRAPAFFLPKIQYRMLIVSDKSNPDRVIYLQQLIDGNAMNSSDGLIVLEKVTNEATRISVVDFFDAKLGAFRPLVANSTLWKKSIEGSFKDDFAFRAKLENPTWSPEQISDAAQNALDLNPIDQIEYTDVLKWN